MAADPAVPAGRAATSAAAKAAAGQGTGVAVERPKAAGAAMTAARDHPRAAGAAGQATAEEAGRDRRGGRTRYVSLRCNFGSLWTPDEGRMVYRLREIIKTAT